MSTPPLPAELIAKIFRYLWLDLSTDLTTAHLVTPRNAPFILAPLRLVSRSFYRLALPLWLGHVERGDRDRAGAALEKAQSRDSILSLHFDPDVPVWDDFHHYDSQDDELDYDRSRWDLVLLEGLGTDLVAASPDGDDAEEAAKDRPVGETLFCIWHDNNLPSLQSLRLNLPAGASIDSIAYLATKASGLTQLRIHFLGPVVHDSPDSMGSLSSPFRTLFHLELRNLAVTSASMKDHIFPALVTAASATLPACSPIRSATPQGFIDAPCLLTLALPVVKGQLPPLPPSVEYLSVIHLQRDQLSILEQSLCSLSGPNLKALELEFERTDPELMPNQLATLRRIAELMASRGVALLGSWWPLLSENSMENELYKPVQEAQEGEESSSEGSDEEDGGSGMLRRMQNSADHSLALIATFSIHLQSPIPSGPSPPTATALSPLRAHFPSVHAFEGGKAAIYAAAEPHLHGE
ncbi:hypothetical protein JCM11641_006544 [Rhodosporidiobolus odoratus]